MIFPSLVQLATRDVVTLDASQSLKEAVHLMNVHHIRDIIVTQGQSYSILTARELIDFQIRQVSLDTPLADLHLNIVPQMFENDSVMKALMVIQNHPDNHVCLINEDKDIIGIVSYSDLAASLQPDQLVQSQSVGDVVRDKPFLQVEASDDLQTVFQKMHQLNETAAIVMQQQAVGIITQTNVIELLDSEHNWQKPVADYMTAPLMTVCGTASVQYALAVSREHHIKHIVVEEQQQVVGVLHQKDLVSLVYESLHQRYENENKQLKQEMDLLKAGPLVSVIWRVAPGWPVKYVTPNLSKVLGYQVSEWVSSGFRFGDLIHPDDVSRISQEVETHIAEKAPYWEQRYRILSKQGQWQWFYDYSQPIYGDNNQVNEVFGYLLDQTHLIETERALQQSEQQYRSLFELYPLATVLIDPDTQLPVRFNKQAYQQLGYPPEIFAHLRIADYEVFESEQKIKAHMNQAQEHEGVSFETQHRHRSGAILDVKVTAKSVQFDDKSFFLSVFEDISALKQSQQALEASHQKERQLNVEKSQFLAYLTHEIRTPLSGMIGLCDMANNYSDIESLKDASRHVSKAAQQLMSLMNDLLDMSKIEANKLTLSLQPIRLETLTREAMTLVEGIKRVGQPVELHLHYDQTLPRLLNIDPQRLRQVLMNLMSNAIKFTEQGLVQLDICLTKLKNDQAWVKFSVTDTGVGISKADLVNLFKPYHRVKASEQSVVGTGLGLAISQQLVQLMGGEGVSVSSEQGKGSCFSFEVPFSLAADGLEVSTSDTAAMADAKQLTGQVLVAEDDAINQQVIQQQLMALGLTNAVLVKNGAQALEKAQQQSFDLVLMDVHMPVMGGLEASRHLLKLSPELPIIALSAANTEQDRQLAEDIGIQHYLAKPVDIKTLYSMLSVYLKTTDHPIEMATFVAESEQTGATSQSIADGASQSVLINRQKGLQQLNGNQILYTKLLNQFLEQLNGDYIQLAKALSEATKHSASDAVLTKLQAQNHGMKGVAANLALTALYEVSQQVDRQLKQQLVPNPELVEVFQQVINDTQQAIQDQLAHFSEQAAMDDLQAESLKGVEPMSNMDLQAALRHLLSDLQSQRFLEVQQLKPIWGGLPNRLQEAYGKPLMTAIDNFEFDDAIHYVSLILNALQESEQ
ncbi:hypothetical protein CYQ88_07050 [Hydrogenovibrio sp. SC-1]|uniref:ATP-binding protein n=1 Tax=Hydrogenovibrio sp. SC-1 TaxID=2065820 RepID=UPI000C7A64E9|nr:ATP-binding protein [Hydrogenovibrio sp. SC-1]PLA74269.1 hypothetical protein CYQ88_07050 [Hydrogenovibrio sp. SC-1]